MHKRFLKTLSLLIVVVIFAGLPSQSSLAGSVSEKSYLNMSKISDELYDRISEMNNEDKISVMVWFESIDLKEVEENAQRDLGYSQTDIKKAEDAITAIDEDAFNLQGEAYQIALNDYKEATKAERLEVLEMQNNLTYKKRQLCKEAYGKNNADQAQAAGLSESSISYKSSFSPIVIANCTIAEIIRLTQKENALFLALGSVGAQELELGNSMSAIQTNYTRNTLGFDGYGVKVGILDGGNIGSHSELTSSQIINLFPDVAVSSHATKVARIICGSNGVAPNAQVYATNMIQSNNVFLELERLIGQGVAVINLSMGFSRDGGYYTDLEMWIDHIAHQHGVTIVKSAGNGGINSVVSNPGLAYNIITVGGTDTKLTSDRSDDTMYNVSSSEGSASANGGTAGCAKPDFLAPAVMWSGGTIDRGTSFAAPMVTGLIAQMIEYKPTIASNPALIKAILTVSTDKKVLPGGSPAVSEVWAGPLTAQQGAGQVNAKNAMATLGKNRYATGTMTSGTVSKTFSVSSNDSWLRYSVAWTRRNTVSNSHLNVSTNAAIAPNLRLQIYNSSNSIVGSSNIPTSSVELVHFTVGTAGTYTAKITRMDTGANAFDYAVAWH